MNKTLLKFVNIEREYHGISITDFATTCNFSRQHMYRLLDEDSNPNDNTIKILIEGLGYDSDEMIRFVSDIPSLFLKWYKVILNMDKPSAQSMFKSFSDYERLINLSHYSLDYEVLKHAYLYGNNRPSIDKEFYYSLHDRVLSQCNERYKSIYCDFLALMHRDDGNFALAIDTLINALSPDAPQDTQSLVNFHLGMLYERVGKIDLALIHNTTALSLFQKQDNIKRALATQVHIANIHLKCNNLLAAESKYDYVLQRSLEMNDSSLINLCLHNLALTKLRQKDYETCLDYLDQIEKATNYLPWSFVQKCQCYLSLNDILHFDITYKKGINEIDHVSPYYSELVLLNYKAHNNMGEAFINHLLEHYKSFSNSDDIDLTLRVLDDIIQYYEANHMYKRANHYLKQRMVFSISV